MSFINLTQQEKQILLSIAKQSIDYGLNNQDSLSIDIQQYSKNLQQQAATFVTLNIKQQLRGCIGTLQAYQPLIADVAEHAFAAAFKDPRFSPLNSNEVDLLEIHISILTPPIAMQFNSEEDLLEQLRPGIDGLILEFLHHKSTFLPSVWENLPNKSDFLNRLKNKAGLSSDFWDPSLKISHYESILISH